MTVPLPPVAPAPGTVYASAVEFFDLRLSILFARPMRHPWCAHWEEHEEAAFVVDLLWKTWELANASGMVDQMAVWLRDFAYPLFMDRLCRADGGPFAGCSWRDNVHDPEACKPLGRER